MISLLEKVKAACRVATPTYNDELNDLIHAALADLKITDIKESVLDVSVDDLDPLIIQAVVTYCKINFGYGTLPSDVRAALESSYVLQKSQLIMSSKYTEWGGSNA